MLAVQPTPFHPPRQICTLERTTVQEIAIKSIAEVILSIGLGFVCTALTPAPTILWIGIGTQCLINIAVRTILATQKQPLDNWLTALVSSVGSAQNLHILLHEKGHALAADCLLKNAGLQIKLFPYIGGTTSFRVSEATELGKKLGLERIQPLIAGAGPLFSLGLSAIQLHVGLKSSSKLCITASLINFLFHAIYAFSSLSTSIKNMGNDFVVLKLAGLSPLVAGIAILAIPLIFIALAPICYNN